MSSVDSTLHDRERTHGKFSEHAEGAQELKNVLHRHPGWSNLTYTQMESLEMIAHKMARILAGNPNTADHWHDIGGYARLCELECE